MSKLIVVVCIGHQTYFDYTIPALYKYAQDVKADVKIVTQQNDFYKEKPHWELLHQMKILSKQTNYNEFLFIDADVLIKPNSPNIFDLKGTHIHAEEHNWWGEEGGKLQIREWTQNNYNFEITKRPHLYYNTGVIKTTLDDIKLMVEQFKEPFYEAIFEQHFLNYVFQKINLDIRKLDSKFNFLGPHTKEESKGNYFLHFCDNTPEERLSFCKEFSNL